MGLSTVAGTVFFFFTVFQCSPVSSYWNRPDDKGACLDIDLLLGIVYAYSGVAILCDFTIGLLPVFLIRDLQLSRRTKISLMTVLGIGCMYVQFLFVDMDPQCLIVTFNSAGAAVIVRIPFLHLAKGPDFLRECILCPLSLSPTYRWLYSRRNYTDIYLVERGSQSGYHSGVPSDSEASYSTHL
jgi:hypothetical protein